MKSVCVTCSQRHWCEPFFCITKQIAYDIDADRVYEQTESNYARDAAAFCKRKSNVNSYSEHKYLDSFQLHLHKYSKECSLFLGVTVAETVLSKVFKNVVRTPYMHRGFDFWCNHQKKIDVKSSCTRSGKANTWAFVIRKNKIADYFLCIAFDNRQDLNPLHLWLIPGNVINHLTGVTFSESTLDKWQEYELPLDKTIACCDTLRP